MSPLHEADVDFADVGTGTLVVMFSVTFKANTAQGKGTHKQNVFGSNLKDKITKDSFYSPPLILTPASSSGPTLPDSESQWEEKISLVKSSDSIFGAMLANKIRAGMSGPFSGLGDKVTAEEQQGDPPSGPKLSDEATLSDKVVRCISVWFREFTLIFNLVGLSK